ncbi:MAG: hypothetical protein WD795_09610 [Woeseia sp.]
MGSDKGKKYCIVDHANKRKELARWTPYEFWLNQVKRGRTEDSRTGNRVKAGRE